jgi:predicted DsbA family dithiol-disulfide isomerase
MNEPIDGAACGSDARATAGSPGSTRAGAKHRLEVVSDVICPWCYIAKRRLESALGLLRPDGLEFRVRWLPFELNPDMPKEGIERRTYRVRKFGSWEQSQARDAQVAEVAAAEGLAFRQDLMTRVPNTFDAHRLIWLSDQLSAQDAVVEGIFRSYFIEGRDIAHHSVLVEIATAARIDGERAATMLAGNEGADEVKAEEWSARRAGVRSVPTFFVDGVPLFSGAHLSATIAAQLRAAVGTAVHPEGAL